MLKEGVYYIYRNVPQYVTRVETCLVAGAKSIIHSLGGSQTKRVHTFHKYLGPKTSDGRGEKMGRTRCFGFTRERGKKMNEIVLSSVDMCLYT